jgi:hypothetical protein
MQRIATATADDGRFVAGNPVSGVMATKFSYTWCNSVQEEICNVIEEAGLTLDVNNEGQLLEAIQLLAAPAKTLILDSSDISVILGGSTIADTLSYSTTTGYISSTLTGGNNFGWVMPVDLTEGQTITGLTAFGACTSTSTLTVALKSRIGTASATTVATITMNSSSAASVSASFSEHTLAANEKVWVECTIDNNGTSEAATFRYVHLAFNG